MPRNLIYTGILKAPKLLPVFRWSSLLNFTTMSQKLKNGGHNDGHDVLPFFIEGRKFESDEQYKTGKDIKEIGGLPSDAELYLLIADPWKDELINDEDKVDLARDGIEQFFIKKKLIYFINGVEFASNKQFIKGSYIRHQGNIPADEEIYLEVPKDWEDELIDDHEWVDLARPGKERFVSRKFEVCIIVNLKEKKWFAKKISYVEVVKLVYPDYDPDKKSYTVKYTNGPKQNPEGSMSDGDIIYVKSKMKFHVSATNKS